MEFLEKNLKTIALGFMAVVVLGLGFSLVSGQSERSEKAAQEAFTPIQAKLVQLKEQNQQTQKDVKEPKTEVNVADLKKDLEGFIAQHPATVASQIAGLSLSEIYASEKNMVEALNTLKKVETKSSVLSNTLVLKKMGQLLADSDQCKEAIDIWNKVLNNKKAEFTFSDVQIKQALCYQKLNETQKAEELLTKVKNNKTEGQEQSSLEAEKVLRLIQFNKAQGS
jgi:tetratricopeptide (TPR) repeat protein